MDWYSRFVVAWRLSTTLTTDFVIEAAKKALGLGVPEITNSDQGVQYTSADYLNIWDQGKTKISMDGRGRAMDNIFTERLWRSVKYDEVYLKDYQTVNEAREGIGAYLKDYNYERLHESLGYQTPAKICFRKEVKI
jgi:putative transposase